mmetsp:Transcript_27590/g.45451  ORF Transcript_27590/g.45451 Transcript_27590/m.45451 type:complete len:231 (-) Transcript_27590:2076-2768(-)
MNVDFGAHFIEYLILERGRSHFGQSQPMFVKLPFVLVIQINPSLHAVFGNKHIQTVLINARYDSILHHNRTLLSSTNIIEIDECVQIGRCSIDVLRQSMASINRVDNVIDECLVLEVLDIVLIELVHKTATIRQLSMHNNVRVASNRRCEMRINVRRQSIMQIIALVGERASHKINRLRHTSCGHDANQLIERGIFIIVALINRLRQLLRVLNLDFKATNRRTFNQWRQH